MKRQYRPADPWTSGLAFAALLLVALAVAPRAAAWDLDDAATREQFSAFHRRFAAAAYAYPGHGASPLGLVGFEVYAEGTGDRGFGDDADFAAIVGDDLTADTLAIGRVGVRKGLPGGIDLGVSYGEAVDGDFRLLSAELEWAVIDGGLVSPALGLRLSGTKTLDGGDYDLTEYGAELILSKGFAVLTPYAGAGVVYSEGTFDRAAPLADLSVDDTRGILYAGVTLNLLLPKITVEVEKAEVVTASLKVGIGF